MSYKKTGTRDFERMREGRLYNPVDKDIMKKHVRALYLCDRYNKTTIINVFRRNRIIKKLIPNIGDNFAIMNTFHCEYGSNLSIGKDFFSNFDCRLLDVAKITIGDGVMFGVGVTLATPIHPLLASERIIQEYPDGYHDIEYAKPITVGNNVWIASNVTVSGGVTIGEGAVIAAGSVVTRDIPANCFAAGVPAKVVRELDENDKLEIWETYVKDVPPLSRRKREKVRSMLENADK